jgi:hypothetical protein
MCIYIHIYSLSLCLLIRIKIKMVRPRFKLHNLCIGHVTTPRVRACSTSSSSASFGSKFANRTEFSSNGIQDNKGDESGNKVMVVVDSSFEAKGALDWALSHTIQKQDTVVLVHVARPLREGENKKMVMLFLFV